MPLPLIKLFWAAKILKYPVAALIETLREYRRRVRVWRKGRIDRRGRDEQHHFFRHPLQSLRDRRFWIKCVTNAAELLVHVLGLAAWLRNAVCRAELDSFVVWRPHHTHEHVLFDALEDAGWRDVFRGCRAYLRNAARLWPAPAAFGETPSRPAASGPVGDRRPAAAGGSMRAPRLEIGPHGRRTAWREAEFDGGCVAVRVSGQVWRQPVAVHRRPGSRLCLWLDGSQPGRLVVRIVGESDDVLCERIIDGPRVIKVRRMIGRGRRMRASGTSTRSAR